MYLLMWEFVQLNRAVFPQDDHQPIRGDVVPKPMAVGGWQKKNKQFIVRIIVVAIYIYTNEGILDFSGDSQHHLKI